MKSLICFVLFLVIVLSVQAQEDMWATEIKKAMDEIRSNPATLPILQRWIQQPSLPGNEATQQELIAEELKKLGLEVETFEVEDVTEMKSRSKLFITPRTSLKGSPIVVGTLKGTKLTSAMLGANAEQRIQATTSGRNIILNGHIDVVPVGDVSQWSKDPFSGSYDPVTKRVHGRGTTDMKGGIFSSLLALMAIRHLKVKLIGDVLFQSVIEEESGGAGSMATILKGFKADGAIIPEPTNLKLFPKQQGSTWFRVKVKGVAAHGGTRYEGISAIEKSYVVIQALLDLEQIRNKRILANEPMYSSFIKRNITNPVPINIGKISGGKWPSSVADEVLLEGRLGVAPAETMESAREELLSYLSTELAVRDEFFAKYPVSVEFFGGSWIPGNVDIFDNINLLLARSYKLYTNEEPVIEASPWGTDAAYYTAHGIPAVVFGPGDTSLAHQTDESISVDNIFTAAGVIARMLMEYCGVAPVRDADPVKVFSMDGNAKANI